MLIKNGVVYIDHGFIGRDIRTLDDRVTEIGLDLIPREGEDVIDVSGLRILPGLIDIHTHGAAGVDVNHATGEDLEKMARFLSTHGVTGFLMSILTDTEEVMMRAIDAYHDWRALPHRGAVLHGIHLEGPFLSVEYKGAMPSYLLQAPDIGLIKRCQERARGAIRYITIAPELPGAIEMIPALKELGICVALGHSAADYETTCRAIAAGACAATHTGNAMRLLHQREPAIFGAVLEAEDVFCEMICDGLHLHPATVRLIMKMKGSRRVIAISDSIMATGLGDGTYMLGVNEVEVRNGDASLKEGGGRAGSTLTLDTALRNLMRFGGWPMEDLVMALTENPARLLHLMTGYGTIEPGKKADLTVLDDEGYVRMTIINGERVF